MHTAPNIGDFMKTKFFLSALAATLLLSAQGLTTTAYAGGRQIDVPLIRGFIPSTGFDDNDTVEFVAYAHLPNSCYRLSGHRVLRDNNGTPTRVALSAIRIMDGVCAEGRDLPQDLLAVVPVTETIRLGRLSAGTYNVSYDRLVDGGQVVVEQRRFDVAMARTSNVDDFRYAIVNSAQVASVNRTLSGVQARLSVTLTSSCTNLGEVLTVRHEDTIVALPQITVQEGVMCTQELRSEERTVDLGTMDDGTYLLHVRSNGGMAKNEVFSVFRPTGR